MAASQEPTTLAETLDDLTRRGTFTVRGERLRAVASGARFPPDEVVIAEDHRFEGVSDPDDMSIPRRVRGVRRPSFDR